MNYVFFVFLLFTFTSLSYQNHEERNNLSSARITTILNPTGDIEGRFRLSLSHNIYAEEPKSLIVRVKVCNKTMNHCARKEITRCEDHSRIDDFFKNETAGSWLDYKLDFIYTGCYCLESILEFANRSDNTNKSCQWINSGLNITEFLHYEFRSDVIPSEKQVEVKWFINKVFMDYDYKVSLKKRQGHQVKYIRSCKRELVSEEVYTLVCETQAAPGEYAVYLHFESAPWAYIIGGNFEKIYKLRRTDYFNVTEPDVVKDARDGRRTWPSWLAGGAVLTVVLLLTAGGLFYYLNARNNDHKLDFQPVPNGPKPERKPPLEILLVYARDCLPFMDVMAELRRLLADYCKIKIWDLYSPEFMVAAGEGAEQWLEMRLRSPAVKVVLVRNPAGAALYEPSLSTDHDDQTINVEPSLLGRVVYRSPHFADSQLQNLYQRVKHDTARDTYLRYYVAQISSFYSPNQLPYVTSHREYNLPELLPTLVKDLMHYGEDPTIDTGQLDLAIARLNAFVKLNPGYLTSEVTLLDDNRAI